MKKKSLALIAITVVMVASIATAFTLAYFTSQDAETNTFTVGNVEIDLDEPNWDGNTETNPAMKANPGVAVVKDPIVTNLGENDAYVRMQVIVSDADVFAITDDDDDTEYPCKLFDINTGWIQVGDAVKNNGTWIYTYNYDGILGTTETTKKTNALFNDVMLPTYFDNDDVAALREDGEDSFTVTVKAAAIQVEGFAADTGTGTTAADNAFAALTAQIAANNP